MLVARALRALRDGCERDEWPANPAMLWGQHRAMVQESLPSLVHHEDDASDTIVTTVNGQTYTVTGGVNKTLLDFLREDIGLPGTKEGCAEGECGACTVFLDGAAVMACLVPAPRAHGAEIVTVEGLAAQDGTLHPLQQAFVEDGRGAVRLLHAGLFDVRREAAGRDPAPHPPADRAEHHGEFVPLYRLLQDR